MRLRVLAVLILMAGCSGKSDSGRPGPGAAPEAPPVTVATAVVRTVPVEIHTFGRAEAYLTVNVKSQVTGTLSIVHVKEGQEVKKDELLMTIDPRAYQAALDLANATLARDTAQARYAKVELARVDKLFEEKTSSAEERDQAQAAADAADATVLADQAAVDSAKLQVEYCSIKSPIDGRVGSFLINQGNNIKANDVPIVSVDQTKPIYVTFVVPETELAKVRTYLKEGLKVDCAIAGDAGPPVEGKVVFIDNTVDVATGTVRLKALFDNTDERLWPGQYTSVALTLTTLPDAILVPSKAVQSGQSGLYVFVVKADNTVENRLVETGVDVGDQTVISKGVSAGETVVTDGQLRLVPGAKVRIMNQPPAGGGAPK